MNIATIVGARPQFIKAAPVSQALQAAGHQEYSIHTGQHYDYRMSRIFFEELGIPKPEINLEIGSGSHGWQTGQMLIGIEAVLLTQKPDWVIVYGDTNSTLAGALAACKLQLPLAHIEAGLRSFNRAMPEEHNRVLTDRCADLLLCPTQTALKNLAREGIAQGVYWVGDTMYDASLNFGAIANRQSKILEQLNLQPKQYLLATIHRASNTDNPETLHTILSTLMQIDRPIVFPVHPRTRKQIQHLDRRYQQIKLIEPVGYLDMLMLEQHARKILTDSGGVQKEAFFFGVPCITLRHETEWLETVETGWNVLAGTDPTQILQAITHGPTPSLQPPASNPFGNGQAAQHIVKTLEAIAKSP